MASRNEAETRPERTQPVTCGMDAAEGGDVPQPGGNVLKTNVVFEIPGESDRPRVALGIYPLRGGFTALLYVGDDCMPPFTPSAELVALVAA